MSREIRDRSRRLLHQSRFLCRRSDRLRGLSNDLLTVAMFRCQPVHLVRKVRRRLVLVA
ncbi:MAG TPA: hypothetical protein VFT28_07330 [Gemmatimonadales bacterium]|nr:hypothetical protein [Gemmatimonadales bacterium]